MKDAKLLILPTEKIIATIKALAPMEIGGADIALYDPFLVTETDGEFYLSPWLIAFTSQNRFEMHSDKFLTTVEPNFKLLAKYEEQFQ